MSLLFWAFVSLVAYSYCGYPLLLFILALVPRRPIMKADITPRVTVIIAAFNEEKDIRRKIMGILAQEYPRDRLEIIVASDGSTDGTAREVSAVRDRRVRLLEFAERRGKTAVQNEAVKKASGEIIVFSDATTRYDPQVIRTLMRNFADPAVGAVGGELSYESDTGNSAGEGGGLYWRYERWIKRMESRVNSLIGVSGCCYAVRRRLYDDIPRDLISDFVIAQMMYRKGRRTVYEPGAVSYESTSESFADEFSMRVRVAVRTLHGLWRMRSLMNPLRYGFFSVQLISHKVFRYLIPVFLAGALVCNAALLGRNPVYSVTFALQCAFYLSVMAGWFWKEKRLISVPFYFFITNMALMVAFFRFLKGDRQVLWKPIRK
ncbi:MAG: glycosyltransferase family 2 protein [Deltaproteobacteria bacterium]